MSVAATRGSRMEKWYRRLLALYPKDHRREHAEDTLSSRWAPFHLSGLTK